MFFGIKLFRVSLVVWAGGILLMGGCSDDEPARQVGPREVPTSETPRVATPAPTKAATRAARKLKLGNIGKLDATKLGVARVRRVRRIEPLHYSNLSIFVPAKLKKKIKSPDGKKLIWRDKVKGSYYLLVSNLDGSDRQVLKNTRNGYQPAWSPNGKNITFTAINWKTGKRSLYKYNLKSQRKVPLWAAEQGVGSVSAWSPDGTKIAFTYFGNLWIMNSVGIGKQMLPTNMKITEADVLGFSDDGARIAYKARTSKDIFEIDLKPIL